MNIHIPTDFTLNELRAFIEGQAREAPEGHYTAQEWADRFRVSVGLMRKLLNKAKKRDLMRKTYARRETLDGRSYLTPVYAFQGVENISDSQESMESGGG